MPEHDNARSPSSSQKGRQTEGLTGWVCGNFFKGRFSYPPHQLPANALSRCIAEYKSGKGHCVPVLPHSRFPSFGGVALGVGASRVAFGRRRVSRRFSRNFPPSEGWRAKRDGVVRVTRHIKPPRPCGAPLQGRGILRTACAPRTCGLPEPAPHRLLPALYAALTCPILPELCGSPGRRPDCPVRCSSGARSGRSRR